MKPIGTITNYFPHVDSKTRKILIEVMADSENLSDFLSRLGKISSQEESSTDLVFLFLKVSLKAAEINRIKEFAKNRDFSPLEHIFVLLAATIAGEAVVWEEMQIALKDALEGINKEWMICDLFLLFLKSVQGSYSESDMIVSAKKHLKEHLSDNNELKFLLPSYYDLQFSLRAEGKPAQWESILKQGLEISKQYDDPISELHFLNSLANVIKYRDTRKALGLLMRSLEKSESIGFPNGISIAKHFIGHVCLIRGEYESAIKKQLESLEAQKDLGVSKATTYNVLTYANLLAMDYANALYWGKKSLRGTQGVSTRREGLVYATYAWAEMMNGNSDIARDYLERSSVAVTTSGREFHLGVYYMVQGICDRGKGDFESPYFYLEKALDIFDGYKHPLWIRMALFHLAQFEVEEHVDTASQKEQDSVRPWLTRFIDEVDEDEAPGWYAQAQILLAKVWLKQGRDNEANELLSRVKVMSSELDMPYLIKIIEKLLILP